MKLSTRARYGLSCMIAVARLSDRGLPVSLERVAQETGVSRRYLEQLAMPLKGAGLLRSVAGRRGGYLLALPAEQIRLRQIFEAAIGSINIVDCVEAPELCPKADSCENRLIYLIINQRICEVLDEYSLADLADYNRLSRLCARLPQGQLAPADRPTADGIARLCSRILEHKASGADP